MSYKFLLLGGIKIPYLKANTYVGTFRSRDIFKGPSTFFCSHLATAGPKVLNVGRSENLGGSSIGGCHNLPHV